MSNTQNLTDLTGRILISLIFLLAGLQKIGGYEGTQAYMAAMGVPGALLPLVIALEVGGAIAIILGWKTRLVAFLLAGFSIVSALIFHRALGDQMQFILFMKNLAMAGGFLFLVARGAGGWSLDARRAYHTAPEGRSP
jgi:putative oxidoreductase